MTTMIDPTEIVTVEKVTIFANGNHPQYCWIVWFDANDQQKIEDFRKEDGGYDSVVEMHTREWTTEIPAGMDHWEVQEWARKRMWVSPSF